ncbi:unnamed protein product [Urochloa humidicola]
MGSKVRVVFLLALSISLALAGGGSVEAGLALQLMAPSTMTTPMLGLEVHRRRVLSSISTSSLNPDSPACTGKCPASGGAYTGGRDCQKVYHCSS